MKLATIEVHDDATDTVTTLRIPEPLWLFTNLLFQAGVIDPRASVPVKGEPVVGSGHIENDKVVLRYHGGDPDEALEWHLMLNAEEADEEGEEDLDWWQR